ncbi:MAG: SOS response-associated peptidase [Alphaproteobacteria bacterium]|nr:SOS response-associated peptidase [Alphaproteobacteria bacterium]
MCNYYQNDIRKAGREREFYGFDEFSEIPLDIYPDSLTGIITLNADGEPQWRAMRWGFPPPPKAVQRPVTNVRNLTSPYWRGWLKPEFRCLVPFTRFSEYEDSSPKGKKKIRWFNVKDAPMAAFAGIWRPWTGVRGPKSRPVEGEHLLYAFLTCAPNAVVAPIHAKAMPVILHTPEAQDAWLTAPASAVEAIAQPLPEEELALEAA